MDYAFEQLARRLSRPSSPATESGLNVTHQLLDRGLGMASPGTQYIINLPVYFASPMFNPQQPGVDMSATDEYQLRIEHDLIEALKGAEAILNAEAQKRYGDYDSNANPIDVQVKIIPVIPRKFELNCCANPIDLVNHDLAAIDSCYMLIANHTKGASSGASMEVFYANRDAKIPVITVAQEEQIISTWQRAHSNYILSDSTDAIIDGIMGIAVSELSKLI